MDGRFFTNCVRNIIEKAVSICVIIPQNRKVKKFQLHIIDQSFEHNGMGISYQKNNEEDRPANARDMNPLETIWINVDETKHKDPSP